MAQACVEGRERTCRLDLFESVEPVPAAVCLDFTLFLSHSKRMACADVSSVKFDQHLESDFISTQRRIELLLYYLHKEMRYRMLRVMDARGERCPDV